MEWLMAFFTLFAAQNECVSSVFGYAGDKWAGGKAACTRRYIAENEIGVAHRTLPCGTILIIKNERTNKIAMATVIDRGPYGAMHEGKWKIKLRKDEPGEWRGCLDLTRRLQILLDHNGFEKVLYVPVIKRILIRKLNSIT